MGEGAGSADRLDEEKGKNERQCQSQEIPRQVNIAGDGGTGKNHRTMLTSNCVK
jgi:hypothetical protein